MVDHATDIQSVSNMAKQVRWCVPFASVNGTQYEVEIYDENWTGSPVVLTAGATPFVTDEDASDDFFAPVRSQTGTLQVCTLLPDGTMLRLEDILPDNNIARPVQLRRLDDDVVEWQGFLSCEAYTQDYVGIPQILDLSLISVLEAMDSVECDPTRLQGVVTVFYLIGYCFDEMERSTNFDLFNRIYIGEQGKAIASRYINTSLFFDTQEQNDEGYNEAILKGISLKEVLTKVATFMGWCVREDREDIYIQTVGADDGWVSGTVAEIMYDHQFAAAKSALYDLADLDWRGTGHRISSRQGARNVEVVANMTPFDIQVGIPDGFPQGEYMTGSLAYQDENVSVEEGETIPTALPYISKEQHFSNRYEFAIWDATEGKQERPIWEKNGTLQEMIAQSMLNTGNVINGSLCGAAPIQFKSNDEYESIDFGGLYVKTTDLDAYQSLLNESIYLLKIRSIDYLNAYNGKFVINFSAKTLYNQILRAIPSGSYIPLVIKWGTLFLQSDRKSWSSSYNVVVFPYTEENGGKVEIPISSYNYGEVVMYIPPCDMTTSNPSYRTVEEWVYTSLSLEYQAPEDVFEDRDANHYFEALKTAFREEVSVECDFGSSLDNLPNPSLILNVDPDRYYEPLTRMIFFDGMQVEERPEKHLLSRLATYYRKPHASLELVAAFPGVLPMMRYRGLNDGKFYLPMAASRDWQQDTATISMLQCEPHWRVYRWDNNVWTKDWDYISLSIAERNSVDLYIYSDVDIEWEDHRGDLPGLYINLDYSRGTIPAGRTLLRIGYDGSTEAEGNINFFWTINGKRQHIFDLPVVIRNN